MKRQKIDSRSATALRQDASITGLVRKTSPVQAPSALHATQRAGLNRTSTITVGASSSSTLAPSESFKWGPAITAAPYPPAEIAGPNSLAQQPDHGMSTGSKEILIAITIIGSAFIVAFLIYLLNRRRKCAITSEIVRFRPHPPSTILSPSHLDDRMTALPIYHTSRYSVRSSKHVSRLNFSGPLMTSATVPPAVAERFLSQNRYVPAWKSSDPLPKPKKNQQVSFLTELTPPPPPLKDPEKAHICTRSLSSSRMTRNFSEDTTKSGFTVPLSDAPLSDPTAGTPPFIPRSQQNLLSADDRWSWTNSQAPATPRMYAPNARNSRVSLFRFRTVKSWVQQQSDSVDLPHSERIEEERPSAAHTKSKPALKNQASKPTLGPRKLRKKGNHAQGSTITSLCKPGSKDLPTHEETKS